MGRHMLFARVVFGLLLGVLALSARALTVTSITPAPNATTRQSLPAITVNFDAPLAAASVNPASVLLIRAGADGLFDTPDDVAIQLQASQIQMLSPTQLSISVSGLNLPADKYRLTLIGSVKGTTSSSDAIVTVPNFGLVAPTDNYTIEFWQFFTGGEFHLPTTFQLTPIVSGDVYQFHSPWNSGPDYYFWDLAGDRTGITNVNTRGVWAHFALVKSGTTKRIYYNGTLVQTDTQLTTFTNYQSDLQLPASAPQPFLGRIDEFRIWNSVRTATQIKNYMNRSLSGKETGLMAYWNFNEGTGTTAKDVTGHGYNGTMATPQVWSASDVPLISPVTDTNNNIIDGDFAGTFPTGDGAAGGDFSVQFTLAASSTFGVTNISPAPGAAVKTVSSILVSFNAAIDSSTVNSNSVHIQTAGVDGLLDTGDDQPLTPTALTVINSSQIRIDLPSNLKSDDKYRVTLSGTTAPIKSVTGQVLDGEYPSSSGGFPSGNDVPGGDFSSTFNTHFVDTVVLVTAPASVPYGTTAVTLMAAVNAAETVNVGTLTFQLKNGSANIGTAVTVPVASGSAGTSYAIPQNTPAGTLTIQAAYSGGDSFGASSDSSRQLLITRAPLTITPDNKSRIYGAANPTLTGSVQGVLNNDAITATFFTNSSPQDPVGTYDIDANIGDPNGALGNYTVSLNTGTLTVTPAVLSLIAANKTRLYGAANPTFTGLIVGLKNNDSLVLSYTSVATRSSPVGTYPIVPVVSDPNLELGNYTLEKTSANLTINPTPLTVTPADAIRAAGTDNPLLTGTITGLRNNDNITATYASAANIDSPIGTYDITATLNDPSGLLGNYTVTYNTGTLRVSDGAPPLLTSSLTDTAFVSRQYTYTITATGLNPLTFGAAGLPDGLSLDGAVISGSLTTVGTYVITLTAMNSIATDTKMLTLTVIPAVTNHPPMIVSEPTASPNPVTVNNSVQFSVSATDADNDVLTYAWDFGDSTTGSGAQPTKAFTVAGTYVVSVGVSDGQVSATQSLNVVVLDAPPANFIEVKKIRLGFNFQHTNTDTLLVSGTLAVPDKFAPNGQSVRVTIGGLDYTMTLDKSGHAPRMEFTLGKIRKGVATFSYRRSRASLFNDLTGLGFTRNTSAPAISFPVVITLAGTISSETRTVSYKVKSNRQGPKTGVAQY